MNTLTENSTLPEIRAALAPIPDEQWIEGMYTSDQDPTCHCVLGHVNSMAGLSNFFSPLEAVLRQRSSRFLKEGPFGRDLSTVNNAPCFVYTQPTPKARVLALLDDMIAAGVSLSPEKP